MPRKTTKKLTKVEWNLPTPLVKKIQKEARRRVRKDGERAYGAITRTVADLLQKALP